MGNVVSHLIKLHTFAIALLVTVLALVALFFVHVFQENNFDENSERVVVNDIIYSFEQDGKLEVNEIPDRVNYLIADKNGIVISTNIADYYNIQQIELHTIGGERRFIVPINYNDTTYILLCDFSDYNEHNSMFFTLSVVVIIIIWALVISVLLSLNSRLKKDVLVPVEELHNSVCDILNGNNGTTVNYDFDGEIGSLCHDFEQMREELQESLIREEKLKSKIHIMYGSISHDLKTSVATITGYLEIIIHDVAKSDDEIKDYARRMLNKSQVINKLIDDILEHSKTEVIELSMNTEEVYAKDFFQKIMREYKEHSLGRYDLKYNLPPDIIIDIDKIRIAEVIDNIISNSIKYSDKMVHIVVNFKIEETPNKILLVSIKDNGKGIDALDLPFVFDCFYRGNKARTQDIPGSGLGLNICKYIVEQHGGNIECDSIVGTGTEISFSIPVK